MPRAFNKTPPSTVYWQANKKAWMMAYLFLEYITQFNESLRAKNQKVCLLLDNATCHCELNLSHTKLLFLPPNTTAGTQPLDAGIIRNFKCKYCQLMLNHLLS